MPAPVFALVDGNSFFASYEKVFRPDLRHRPVIVLSNNDGCVVAHSTEAKQLGIKMCQPFFEIEDLYFRKNVSVFSSNYELYANLSGCITLRKEGSYAQVVGIVLNTNSFRTQDPQYHAYPCIGLEYPISDTRALIRCALKLLDKYYRSGYLYKRAGVYVGEVIPEKTPPEICLLRRKTPDKTFSAGSLTRLMTDTANKH